MTAQEQMRKMLDELMGTKRDGVERDDEVKFTDDRVCKSYIMGLCPHELFNNTRMDHSTGKIPLLFFKKHKMDLGDCSKMHAAALKADFEAASKTRDYGFDVDQMENLQAFIKDCDRKIQIAKKRLEETQDDQEETREAKSVRELADQIGQKLAQAEALGAEGKVEESMELLKEMETLKAEKKIAEERYRNTLPSSSLQQQKLRVCEVCAAYLSLYDNDRRLADHFGGKLHMGFIKIRDRLAELQSNVMKKREDREKERQRRREEREREVELEREKRERERREREKERERARERERDRHRDRDRDRDRNRDRDRDRDRDRQRRRKGRSRSRSRSHSRDRNRRKRRTRSRSKDRRSRSRTRSRSRSRAHNSRRRSRSRSPRDSRSQSPRRSRTRSRSRSASPPPRKRSRSPSPSPKSRSPSKSRSRSKSHSRSKSRSRSE